MTSDIKGPILSGGVATIYTSIALLLAKNDFDVTVLYANHFSVSEPSFAEWQKEYFAQGVKLISFKDPKFPLQKSIAARRAQAVYEQIKNEDFDLIHFPDYCAVGYFCLLAKKQGLAFQNTQLVTLFNGTHEWLNENNNATPDNLESLVLYDMERRSVELADHVVCASQYSLDWMKQAGYKIPMSSHLLLFPPHSNFNFQYGGSRKKFDEIVFFGRIEERKGIREFCAALELLPKKSLHGIQITFLGNYGRVNGVSAQDYLKQWSSETKIKTTIITQFDQENALKYLTQSNAFVVLPTKAETFGYTFVECLLAQIPFLASKLDSFDQMLPVASNPNIYFDLEPKKIADQMQRALIKGIDEPKAARYGLHFNEKWISLHHKILATPKSPGVPKRPAQPFVSVIMTHKDRPELLKEALASLKGQTYTDFEILVADDGSVEPKTLQLLKGLKSRDGIKVVSMAESVGPARARNEAAKKAQGKYLVFLDDDNLAKPNFIDELVRVAETKKSDVVVCGMDCFQRMNKAGQPKVNHRWMPISDDLAISVFDNNLGDMNCLILKKTFDELGGLEGNLKTGFEDWAFFFTAIARGYRFDIIPEPLIYYRVHKKNFSKRIDYFETLKLRVEIVSRVLPPGFRKLVNLLHAWKFMQGYREGSAGIYKIPPMKSKDRTDFFEDQSHSSVHIFSKKKLVSHLNLINKLRAQKSNHFQVFKSANSKKNILLFKNRDPKVRAVRIVCNAMSFASGKVQFIEGEGHTLGAFAVKKGKNTIDASFSLKDSNISLDISSELSGLCITSLEFYFF